MHGAIHGFHAYMKSAFTVALARIPSRGGAVFAGRMNAGHTEPCAQLLWYYMQMPAENEDTTTPESTAASNSGGDGQLDEQPSTGRSLLALIICLALPFAAGVFGALFMAGSWYDTLQKPVLTPPGWVFPVAWNILYALMGIALFRVWRASYPGRPRSAYVWFGAQLVLNALWSVLMFGLHSPVAALLCLVALWLAIAETIFQFAAVDRLAAWLLVPYLCWVSFAGYLNLALYALNPSAEALLRSI